MRSRATPDIRARPRAEPRAAPRTKPGTSSAPSEADVLSLLNVMQARLDAQDRVHRRLEAALDPAAVRAVDETLDMFMFPHMYTRERAKGVARGMAKVAGRVQENYERAHRHLPVEWLRVADRLLAVRMVAASEDEEEIPMSPLARARFRTGGWADRVPGLGALERTVGMVAGSTSFQMATQLTQRLNSLSSYYLSQSYDRYLREDARLADLEKIPKGRRTPAQKEEWTRILASTPGAFEEEDYTDDEQLQAVLLGGPVEERIGAARAENPAEVRRAILAVRPDVRFSRVAAHVEGLRAGGTATSRYRAANGLLKSMALARRQTRRSFVGQFEERREMLIGPGRNLNLRKYATFGAGGGWERAVFHLTDYMNAKSPEFSLERRDKPRWKEYIGYVGTAARICSFMGKVSSTLTLIERDLQSERIQRFITNNYKNVQEAADESKLALAVGEGVSGFYTLVGAAGGGDLTAPQLLRAGAVYLQSIEGACAQNNAAPLLGAFGRRNESIPIENSAWPKNIETWAETLARTGQNPARLSAGTVLSLEENNAVQNKTFVYRGGASQFVQLLAPEERAYVIGPTDRREQMQEQFRMQEDINRYASERAARADGSFKKAMDHAGQDVLADSITDLEATGILAEAIMDEVNPAYRVGKGFYTAYRYAISPDDEREAAAVAKIEKKLSSAFASIPMNAIGGAYDYTNWIPLFMRKAQEGQTLWKTGRSLAMLWGYYRSLAMGDFVSVGWTIAHAILLHYWGDARTAFLWNTVIASGVTYATRFGLFLFSKKTERDGEMVIEDYIGRMSSWARGVFERILQWLPMRAARATRWGWDAFAGGLCIGFYALTSVYGGVLFAFSMVRETALILQLLGNMTVVLNLVVVNLPLILGIATVGALGMVAYSVLARPGGVGRLAALSASTSKWFHRTFDASFSLGALIIDRPDITLMGIRVALQLVTASTHFYAPGSAAAAAILGDGRGLGDRTWDTISTLAALAHPKVLWGQFTRMMDDDANQIFESVWNLSSGSMWPLVTGTFPATEAEGEQGERRQLNILRVLTCGVMAESVRRRNWVGGDGDFMRGCLDRAFSQNLGPPTY